MRSGGYGTRLGALALSVLAVVIAGVVVVPTLASGRTNPAQTSATKPAIYGVVKLDRKNVQFGGKLHGSIVFHNSTGSTKVLYSGCKADGLYVIGLLGKATDRVDSTPATATVACAPLTKVLAKPGRTVYRFSRAAIYSYCLERKDTTPQHNKNWVPECRGRHHDKARPLPPGKYRVVFVPNGQFPKGIHVQPGQLTIKR